MRWEYIFSPESISDVDEKGFVLFSFPITTDVIENWKEIGRTCAGRISVSKRCAGFSLSSIPFNGKYFLELDGNELVKKVCSSVTGEPSEEIKNLVGEELLEGMTQVTLKEKVVGRARLDDFRAIGTYAVKRMPSLAGELCGQIDRGSLGYSKRLGKELREDYLHLQACVSKQFYDFFCGGLMKSKCVGDTKPLIELVAPLNVVVPDDGAIIVPPRF